MDLLSKIANGFGSLLHNLTAGAVNSGPQPVYAAGPSVAPTPGAPIYTSGSGTNKVYGPPNAQQNNPASKPSPTSSPSVLGTQTTNNQPKPPVATPPTTPPSHTGPGFGGTTTGSSQNGLLDSQQQAEQKALNDLLTSQQGQVGSYYDNLKNNFSTEANQLGTQKDNLLSNLSSDFQNIINGITGQGQKNIDALNQQESDLNTNYDQAGTNTRNALQDAQKSNRNFARALGDLDSSYYQDLQDQSTENAQNQIGSLASERAGNLNSIETAKTQSGTDVSNAINTANTELQKQKDNILSTYQSNVDAIQNDTTLNEEDRANALSNLQAQYSSNLANLQNNFTNYKLNLMASTPSSASGLSLTPFSPVDVSAAQNALQQLQQNPQVVNLINTALNGSQGTNFVSTPSTSQPTQPALTGAVTTPGVSNGTDLFNQSLYNLLLPSGQQ